MRVVAALAALMLLAGCDQTGGGPAKQDALQVNPSEGVEGFASTGSGFDYRYAYRLRGDRLKAVLQSNADACDRLGPARCRILAMRYRVADGGQISAVLTLKIDPAIARSYGEAVTKAVTGSDGLLVDTEITGADSTNAARSLALINRLRDQLKSAQTQAATDPSAKARADKIQGALDTITEVEAGQGQSLATAPVLMTYESSNALTGLGSADANFRNAGTSLESSVSRVLIFLALVGPWLLVLLVLVIVLRWIVHGRGGMLPAGESEAHAAPAHHEEERHDNRNLIQRWFSRDDDNNDRRDEEAPHN
ncbi:MAG: hypothetical protein V4574_05625 [Pseudomonadota bacterium]